MWILYRFIDELEFEKLLRNKAPFIEVVFTELRNFFVLKLLDKGRVAARIT